MGRIVQGRRRLLWSFALGLALCAIPGSVSADPLVKFSEHFVSVECFLPGDIFVVADSNSEFGESASIESPEWSGETSAITVTEGGGGATIEAVIPLTDGDGNAAGDAVLNAVLTPTGAEEVIEPFRDGNRWNKSTGVIRFMAVSGSLVVPGATLDLATEGCFGVIGDVEVFETQPHAFVGRNAGVLVDCFWETDDSSAYLFAISDSFGEFTDAFLAVGDEHLLFASGPAEMTLTAESFSAAIPMFDEMTGLEESATVTASFEPSGDPVKSVIVTQNSTSTTVEQLLIPDGELAFSTGQTFSLDGDSCFASVFDSHSVATGPSGPKASGPTPVNDDAAGAVALDVGEVVNQQTKGTATAPELPVTTCPQAEFDAFGHTLWYTFTGTGGEVTVDTAGSNFDTIVAIYDDSLTELACEDDVLARAAHRLDVSGVTDDRYRRRCDVLRAGGRV